MTSLLLRDIEHWTQGFCSFTIGAAQPGDLVVYRKGGKVREVTRVLRNGHLWAEDANGKRHLITRPEEFRVMKTISATYVTRGFNKVTRIEKTRETLDL